MAVAHHNDVWSVFDQAPGALLITDEQLVVVRANAAFGRLAGRDPGTLLGSDGLRLLAPATREDSLRRLQRLLSDGKPYVVDQRVPTAEGRSVWMRVRVALVEVDGDRYVMAQVEDTTAERRSTARLQRLAERDHLTGLLNRRRIENDLDEALEAVHHHGRRAALILIDLDCFKAVNDRMGHETGDKVLASVAATLATRVRGEDAVARIGGDEFAVLLRDVDLDAAERVAAELVTLIAQATDTNAHGVTASAGVAPLTHETKTAQDALRAADRAMYAAKAAGRNHVSVSSDHPPAARHAGRRPARAPRPIPPVDAQELLGGLREVAEAATIPNALQAVRELLEMDVSFVSRFTEDEQVVLASNGGADFFDTNGEVRFTLEKSYCRRILDGTLPAAMPDVGAASLAAGMPAVPALRVGAFAAVPIRLSDGTLYGTLAAGSHRPMPWLGERDLRFLAVLARMIAGELERDAAVREQHGLRVQAAGAEALLAAVDARDRRTVPHRRASVTLAGAIATQLALDDTEQRQVSLVALLHDIGKLAVGEAVLTKPGPLDAAELALVRQHPTDGERIVAAIPELAHVAGAIRSSHERWDGTGYPDGLAGEAIPIASRVISVCDAWSAMTSDRPYRRRLSRQAALAEVAAGAGRQFDRACAAALLLVLARADPVP